VYGKRVNDLNVLDKQAIYSVGIAAIQQMDKVIQEQQEIIMEQNKLIEEIEEDLKEIIDVYFRLQNKI